jgi:hypothetical protein
MGLNPLKMFTGLIAGQGQIKQAKEQKKVADQNSQLQFESALAGEGNQEDNRIMRMQQFGNQLQGARALSPEVIAAALKRRASTVRKGLNADTSKGMRWGQIGNAVGDLGDLAGTVITGGMKNAVDAGSGILSQASKVTSGGSGGFNFGGSNFNFDPRKDLE